jgi:hypothetical protein
MEVWGAAPRITIHCRERRSCEEGTGPFCSAFFRGGLRKRGQSPKKDAMRLIDLLSTLRSRGQMAQLAAELVRRTRDEVAAKVGDRIERMSIAEARGYVRARARGVLESHLNAVLRQPNLSRPAVRTALVDEALERTIMMLVGQKLKAAPMRTMRRAA